MSNDLDIFLQRLVDQDTIMQQTAEAIKMCASRDMSRNIQSAEIATVDRLEKSNSFKSHCLGCGKSNSYCDNCERLLQT